MKKLQRFLHKWLYWGFPDQQVSTWPGLETWRCKFCDKEIAKDPFGNYFHL